MQINLYDGFSLIVAQSLNVEWHSHSAFQLTLSLDKKPLECETETGVLTGMGVLIPVEQSHRFQNHSGRVLIILVDEESNLAESFKSKEIQVLNNEDYLEIKTCFDQISQEKASADRARELLFSTKLFLSFANSQIDERLKSFITELKQQPDFIPSVKEAAAMCNLSESRFMHLFKEELGLPFRKYILWTKLLRTFMHLQSGASLTQAAHMGGFSDSSHLSRFFTKSFGLNPSDVLK